MNKRRLLTAVACLCLTVSSVNAQKVDFSKFRNFDKANAALGAPKKGVKRVVFMGNSITIGWIRTHKSYFEQNQFIDRGISGQTSYQFLLRFREDVINLQPRVVVINYGTNDIAENTGPYDENLTYGNVVSMVELARAHKIKVILTSCLPAGEMHWNKAATNVIQKIRSLNARVKAYAQANKIPYVDYFSAMVTEDGSRMKPELTRDGVHPNGKGYDVMEALVTPVIKKLR